ncbi:hypothetical protein J1614_007564 [Plenodomus biglobosus]|nr:hypothetical protein J1614_007564 [Plenodomus biglobosus]
MKLSAPCRHAHRVLVSSTEMTLCTPRPGHVTVDNNHSIQLAVAHGKWAKEQASEHPAGKAFTEYGDMETTEPGSYVLIQEKTNSTLDEDCG